MATEREEVQALFNKEPEGTQPPTVDDFQMGGDFPGTLGDFVRQHQELQSMGQEQGLLVPDSTNTARPPLVDRGRPDLFESATQGMPAKHPVTELNENLETKLITKDQHATIEDEFLNGLIADYQDDEFARTQLQNIGDLPRDQQLNVLAFEIEKRDALKLSAREALLVMALRAGYNDMTVPQFEQLKRGFSAQQLDGFRHLLREQQTKEIRAQVDAFAADQVVGGNFLENMGEVINQDFYPVTNVLSRIGYANAALDTIDADIGWFRQLFPGESRQAAREWWVNADIEERKQFVKDLGSALEEMKRGPAAQFITDYGIMEHWAELFTDDLLNENVPTNTLDRVLGTVDVIAESIYGVGLILKVGGRGIKSVYRTNNALKPRRVARTTGNHELVKKLDADAQLIMRQADIDPSESALVNMPRPPNLADEREVLPDDLKDIVDRGERIRSEILINSDDITGIALTIDDKANVVRKELSQIDSADGMVVNPKMSVLQALPNDTGFKYTAVYGETASHGWTNISDALDEALALDPNLENLKVMRKNSDGNLEEVTDLPALVKGTSVDEFRLSELSDEEFLTLSRQVSPESDRWAEIEAEAVRRSKEPREFVGDALRDLDGDEFFLQMEHERFWHTTDKEVLGPNTWRDTGIKPKWLLTPSRIFGSELFRSFDKAYRIEQQTIRRFEQIYKPYYDLSPADKRFVSGAFDWFEQYAKQNGRIPDIGTIQAKFDGITNKQLGGILALNQGLNVQWEMFNRRLYREWHFQGFKTAKPFGVGSNVRMGREGVQDALPVFHGKVLDKGTVRSQMIYDPITQKQVRMTADEVVDLYDNGGGVMKLDMAIDVPGEAGKANTLVRLDPEHYKVGKLDNEVLTYHPGYFTRFYDDPYFIIKRGAKEIDGTQSDIVEDAIRTAGSVEEAERFVRRFATYDHRQGMWINNEDPTKTYRIQRATDLDQTESSLFTKQSLNREGRLFWDKRNFDRLPDVNGNRAALEDPVLALERSTVMATRQTTHEDLMKSMKLAFHREFKGILSPTFPTDSINETITRLRKARKSVAEPSLKKRYNDAIEFAKYIRIQQGTDEVLVPLLREGVVKLAGTISRLAGRVDTPLITDAGFKLSKVLENYASSMDPLRWARSVAFHAFMVFRPVRQVLLQSAQISFLTALDPLYIGTGRVIKDGGVLRSGLLATIRSDYDDGLSFAKRAKLMGLSQKQYKRLVNEFDRSGLLDTVDVHSFAGGARRPSRSTTSSAVGAGLRSFAGVMQRYGFDTGEQLNLSFTYMIAMRKYMRENGIDDLMKLQKSQWDDIAANAQQLALGMTKPNKMWYQSGAIGNMTQFLSFGHKALLALMGQNPALTAKQARRMIFTGYTLFGASMFGAQEWVRGWLADKGLDRFGDKELSGFDGTLYDLMTLGVIQVGLNGILRQTWEDHKDIDTSFLAPAANIQMLWEDVIGGFIEHPWGAAVGPFGSIGQGALEALDFVEKMRGADQISYEDKVIRASKEALRGTLPLYNDIMTAYQAYKINQWHSRSGRALPVELEPVLSAILGRAALGIRTVEELAYFEANNEIWQTKENMKSIIEGNRDHLLKQLNLYHEGKLSKEFLREQLELLMIWSEDWPEHLRFEIFRQSMLLENQDGESPLKVLAENVQYLEPSEAVLLREFESLGIPPEGVEELIQFYRELHEQRSKNAEQFIGNDLQDAPIWQN